MPHQASLMHLLQQLPPQPFTSSSPAKSHHPQTTYAATVPTLAEQSPQPSGNLDPQETPPPLRATKKRQLSQLSLRSRQNSFRRPHPLHLDRAAKSSSARPTLSDFAVGRNSANKSPSTKSWLGKPYNMPSQSNAASPAADLLRQTMMHK